MDPSRAALPLAECREATYKCIKKASGSLWDSGRMSTTLWKLRHFRAAGIAVGAVAIAGIAVVATASAAGMSLGFRPSAPQSSQSTDAALTAVQARATSAACGEFMKHFAVEIGKSQADINSAFQRAIADTLVDEVKAGHL